MAQVKKMNDFDPFYAALQGLLVAQPKLHLITAEQLLELQAQVEELRNPGELPPGSHYEERWALLRDAVESLTKLIRSTQSLRHSLNDVRT